MSESPFRLRTGIVLAAVMGASFLAFVLWSTFKDDVTREKSWGADSYSRSALGHHLLVEILRELDIPVATSQHATPRRAGTYGIHMVLEPDETRAEDWDDFRSLPNYPERAVFVLPKWKGVRDPELPRWVERVELRGEWEVSSVLGALGIDAELVRPESEGPWKAHRSALQGILPDLLRPQLIDMYSWGEFEPLISCPQGVLAGLIRSPDRTVLVVSDPDVFSNHGLSRGRNDYLAIALLETIRDGDGTYWIDETVHGFSSRPNVYRELFEFPLGLATLSALLCVVVLLWATLGRFGAPEPALPGTGAGTVYLVHNVAGLLLQGSHGVRALERYADACAVETGRRLHAPAGLDRDGLWAWLAKIEESRKPTHRHRALRDKISGLPRRTGARAPAVIALATDFHAWRQELIGGRSEHSGN